MTKVKNNELTHTANSGTSNLVLGSSGQVTIAGDLTPSKLKFGSDAAGDIAYYNGTGYTRLAKGTNGHYLKQGSSNAPEWAAVSAANLLQVKITTQGNTDIQSGYTSTTLADMLSVTITPVATSSKFLVLASFRSYKNGNGNNSLKNALVRNVDGGGFSTLATWDVDGHNEISNNGAWTVNMSHFYLDAPTYDAGEALIYKSQSASAGASMNLGRHTEIVVAELASGTA